MIAPTSSAPAQPRGGDKVFALVVALVALALIVPVWLPRVPPLSDFVNHLARIHVLAHHAEVSQYQQFYEPAWGPYPNLAFDLIGVPLTRLLPVVLVGKLFLTLTLLVWCAGCLLLGKALLGRFSWRSLVACFFALNESFLLGYCNFTFGVALALIAIALVARAGDRPRAIRLVLASAVALLAAVSHAAAVVTMAMALAGVLLGATLERRRRGEALDVRGSAMRAAAFAPAGLYFLCWLVFFADRSADRAFSGVGPSTKLLVFSMLPTFDRKLDLAVLAALGALAVVALVMHRPLRLRWPAAGAAVLLAFAVYIAPADFAGSYEANGRYALGAWVFGLFAIDGAAPRIWLRRVGPALAAVAVLLGRQAVLARALTAIGHDLDQQIALFERLPEGSRLGNLTFLDAKASRAEQLTQRAILHATSFAVVTRNADVPTLYAIRGVQPLRHRQPRYDVHRFRVGHEGPFETERIRRELDAVWLCRAPPALRAELANGAEPLGAAGPCELLRWR